MTSWTNPDEVAAAPKKEKKKSVAMRVSTASKRLSFQPEASDEPAYQGEGPAAPTNRTSARTSIRLGAMGAPAAGSRLSMADIARAKKVDQADVTGVGLDDVEVKSPPLEDRFAKLRALRERAAQGGPAAEEEVVERQIDLEDLTATAVAEVTYDLNMNNYAEQYFQVKKKGAFGKKATPLDQILTHSKDKIKASLHPLSDPALVHDAVLAFTNIQCYMGDKASRNPVANANKVFKITVQCPEELRDEILCQLVKQTTANPDATSTLRGWELMAMCAGLFPPSAKLEKYLLSYMRRTVEQQSYPGVGKLAEYALLRSTRTMELGPRNEAPTEMEIAAVRGITPVALRVHLLDGAILNMEAESWTTVEDLNDTIARQLRIKDSAPFGLFEVNNKDEERALEDETRVLDVISYWDREKRLARRAKDAPTFQFVYKVRLFFDIKEDDEAAIEVAYHQAVHDVTDSRYPCTEEDAFRLAALQAQEKFGDFDGTDVFGGELSAFLPAKYYDDTIVVELKQAITDTYKLLNGYNELEARANYLDYVKSWKIFGSAYFFVEPQNSRAELPPTVVLAVNAKGILIVDMDSKEFLSEYPYSELVTWGQSAVAFVLVVGNLVRTTKLYFKTNQGAELNTLVHAYVNRLVED